MSTTLPISTTAPNAASATGTSADAAAGLTSGDFLTLLTTELQNQDPTSPVDDTQSVAQLAQFSALSATEELNTSFQNFQSNFAVLQSASLVGKTVTVDTTAGNSGSQLTGTISSVSVQNGQPYFTLTNSSGTTYNDSNGNPLLFSSTQIVGIGS
jgi:flagellar basal-body rod modification protein FlgD